MNADPIARAYRWVEYAAFGRALERCRFASLAFTSGARDVLILGEGDGRFLARLLAANPDAHVDVVDVSAGMLALAGARVHASDRGRVRFHQKEALAGPADGDSYDVIVTNFFLDCFSAEDAAALIGKWEAALKPGGVWVVGEFHEPEHGIRRLHARAWHAVMYRFFQMTTGLEASRLPPYVALLKAAGLTLVQEKQTRFGLIISQVWRKPV